MVEETPDVGDSCQMKMVGVYGGNIWGRKLTVWVTGQVCGLGV